VKLPIELRQPIGIRLACGGLPVEGFDLRDVVVGHLGHGEASGQRFQCGQDPVVLLHFLRLSARDGGPPVHVCDHETLRLEASQRLPHRRVAHIELFGEVALAKRRAGRELPVGDELSECVGNQVTLADVFALARSAGCRIMPEGWSLVSSRGREGPSTRSPVLAHGLRVLMMDVAGS
jgi:hypothetical protein